MSRRAILALASVIVLSSNVAALAQLLPGGPSLPSLPSAGGLPLPEVSRSLEGVERAAGRLTPELLAAARLDRLRDLVRSQPRHLDIDELGQPVVRGEILAVSPDPANLEAARAAGFTVLRSETDPALGVSIVTLAPPGGLDVRKAVAQLRRTDPAGSYDYNHVYLDAGASTSAASTNATPGGAAVTVGLLDGGVDARNTAFAGVGVEQRGFAGVARPSPHGTATASLLGAGKGGKIRVADVYGDGKVGGSASSIVAALGWMAASRTPVVNISLVGPPNAALGAGVKALIARGHLIVAAVGNDGPAAPPLYPASYPGVIAVTGTDAHGKPLPEAGKALHLDFAAQGAGLRAARPGGGTTAVRGSSFAAPIVAGRLARLLPAPDPAAAARAVDKLAGEARDLGAPGRDGVFGRGFVAPAPGR